MRVDHVVSFPTKVVFLFVAGGGGFAGPDAHFTFRSADEIFHDFFGPNFFANFFGHPSGLI